MVPRACEGRLRLGLAVPGAGNRRTQGLSQHQSSLSIILPALNEAENVGRVVREALDVARPVSTAVEVLVIDDGSTDDTAAIVGTLAARDPSVRLVRHQRNLGYGAAIRSGIANATNDLILITDADGQFDLADVPRVLAALGDADCVVGYRRKRSDPVTRVLLGQFYRAIIRVLFGITARDPECAFKLFRRAALARIPLRSDHGGINVELLLGAQRGGLDIVQIPVTHRPRAGGRSQISPLYAIRSLVWVFAYRLRG